MSATRFAKICKAGLSPAVGTLAVNGLEAADDGARVFHSHTLVRGDGRRSMVAAGGAALVGCYVGTARRGQQMVQLPSVLGFTPVPGGGRVISFRKANAKEARDYEQTRPID